MENVAMDIFCDYLKKDINTALCNIGLQVGEIKFSENEDYFLVIKLVENSDSKSCSLAC